MRISDGRQCVMPIRYGHEQKSFFKISTLTVKHGIFTTTTKTESLNGVLLMSNGCCGVAASIQAYERRSQNNIHRELISSLTCSRPGSGRTSADRGEDDDNDDNDEQNVCRPDGDGDVNVNTSMRVVRDAMHCDIERRGCSR